MFPGLFEITVLLVVGAVVGGSVGAVARSKSAAPGSTDFPVSTSLKLTAVNYTDETQNSHRMVF